MIENISKDMKLLKNRREDGLVYKAKMSIAKSLRCN